MPDVNLLKDTQEAGSAVKKPIPPLPPELTNPKLGSEQGVGKIFRSLFRRGPKPLPTAAAPVPTVGVDRMAIGRAGGGERILSETKRAAPAVIPLPEEDESSYNVNLLSEDLVTTVEPRKRWILLIVIVVASVIVVGLGYGGLLLYQQNVKKRITQTQHTLDQVKLEIGRETTTQQEAVSTVAKVAALQSLIDRHHHWTKFFSLIEKYTLKSVTYGPAFSADMNGTLSLTASTGSYEDVAKQYLIFDQLVRNHTFINTFSITGASSKAGKEEGSTVVNFVVTMTLLPDDFTVTKDEFKALQSATSTTGSSGLRSTVDDQAIQALVDATIFTCHLQTNPEDVALYPEFIRADALQFAQEATAADLRCSTYTADQQAAVLTKARTDSDQDGINAILEALYGTSDTTKDSGNGKSDYEYIRSQVASDNAETTPTNTNQ